MKTINLSLLLLLMTFCLGMDMAKTIGMPFVNDGRSPEGFYYSGLVCYEYVYSSTG
jgi:hypothetical protein